MTSKPNDPVAQLIADRVESLTASLEWLDKQADSITSEFNERIGRFNADRKAKKAELAAMTKHLKTLKASKP